MTFCAEWAKKEPPGEGASPLVGGEGRIEELRGGQHPPLAYVGESVQAHRGAENGNVERMVEKRHAEAPEQERQPPAGPAFRQPLRRGNDEAAKAAGPKSTEQAVADSRITLAQ